MFTFEHRCSYTNADVRIRTRQEMGKLVLGGFLGQLAVELSAVDAEQLRRFRAEGGSALIATHDLEAIPAFCDRVLLLNRRVLACGPTAEVFTQANLLRTFGASPERPQ